MKKLMTLLAAAGVLLALGGAGRATAQKQEPGFVPLFNGKDLGGWEIMNKGQFSVKDGVIFLDKGSGWLRSEKEYKDFELRVEFRFLNKGADSGIFVLASKDGNNWPSKNYQIQTADAGNIGQIFVAGYKGVKQTRNKDNVKKAMKPVGEWQSFVIVVKAGTATVDLNGERVTDAEGLVDNAGYIGLQGEGGQLEFKNIRVKELK